jgi:hypothetical protein
MSGLIHVQAALAHYSHLICSWTGVTEFEIVVLNPGVQLAAKSRHQLKFTLITFFRNLPL